MGNCCQKNQTWAFLSAGIVGQIPVALDHERIYFSVEKVGSE